MEKKQLYLVGALICLAVILFCAFALLRLEELQKSLSDARAGTAACESNAAALNAGIAQCNAKVSLLQAKKCPDCICKNGTLAENKSAGDKVVLDFLYSETCPHCQVMQPIVSEIESQLPKDRFEVRRWSAQQRGNDQPTSGIYSLYSRTGQFSGYVPVFVINGNASIGGEISKEELLGFICAGFSPPKPDAC